MLFQFINTEGVIVGTKATPNWMYLQKNGCYGLCDKKDAQGVAIDGTPYHLEGRNKLEGLETVSYICITEEEYKNQILGVTENNIQEAIKEGVNSI